MSENGSDAHYALAITTAQEAIKSLLLVNGGAATALIAIMTKGQTDFARAIVLFGFAALLNAMTFVFGYYSQLAYANARAADERCQSDMALMYMQKHSRRQKVALSILVTSLGCSVAGMVTAYLAI